MATTQEHGATSAGTASEQARPGGWRCLTSLGSWAMTTAVVLTVVGQLRGDVWMYLLALLAAAALIVSWFAVPRLPIVTVSLLVPEIETVGRPTRAQLVIRSGAHRVPRHRVTLYSAADRLTSPAVGSLLGASVVVEAMAPRETQTLDLELHPQVRGGHPRVATQHQTAAPFALVRRMIVLAHDAPRVVAAGVDVASADVASLVGDGTDGPVTMSRSGSDVHALRAWSPGDGTAVHWRTTARRGEPVVVDRESRPRTGLVVVLGAASTVEGQDAVVARAAGAALAAVRTGAEVHLVSSQGLESLGAHEEDLLVRFTAIVGPAPEDPDLADLAARTAGAGGRVLVVHGPGPQTALWRTAAERQGADTSDCEVAARPAYAPADLPPGALPWPLLPAVLASVAGGVLGMIATGVLTGVLALGWTAVLALTCLVILMLPAALGGGASRMARTVASGFVVVMSGVIAFQLVGAGSLEAAASSLLCGITTAQLISARTRRDGLVALSLGPVMIVAAAGFGPGPSLVLPTIVVTWAVLAGLAAVARSVLEDGATVGDGQTRLSGSPSGAVIPIAAAVVLGLVAFLVLPLGSAPTMGASLLGDRSRAPDAAAAAALRTTSYFGDAMDLAARGRLPDTTAFTVRPGSPALWRAQTHDQVVDGVWSSTAVFATFEAADGRVALPVDPADADAPRRPAQAYAVRPVGGSLLVAPGPPRSVAGPLLVDQTHTNAFRIDDGATPYEVTAVPQEAIDGLERSGRGPDLVAPTFVTTDPTTTVRTAELARSITAGLTDRVARVRAVESWLRANVRYQLDAPLPPSDQDPVDFLLFDSRAGFCEHFAAAEAVMLRSLGIPSRIATGFAVTDDVIDADGWSVVRDSDAHAWVEVWIEGHGWVSSDPTAGSALLDPASDASPVQRLRDAWNRLWSDDAGRRLLALGLIALVAVSALGALVLRRRRSSVVGGIGSGARTATLEPLAAFGRFRSALGAEGDGFLPGDGVAEVRLAVVGDPELEAALDVVERTLYDRVMPPSQQRLATAELLDSRTAALVARRRASVDA